ncbi:LuxR C-terminal-related transcriptional regulator [Spirosoma sp. SC4-14]|uniref:response regulator transcription factor n=1 Tax=Spirosoma sp. SC4-14 TaxID=3128900 RepID=UPI0030CAE38A
MNTILPFQPPLVAPLFKLSNRELHFIQLACTELTYVQIADRMHVSPRTVDGYREALFERLQLKSRVGLALWAVRMGLVTP